MRGVGVVRFVVRFEVRFELVVGEKGGGVGGMVMVAEGLLVGGFCMGGGMGGRKTLGEETGMG